MKDLGPRSDDRDMVLKPKFLKDEVSGPSCASFSESSPEGPLGPMPTSGHP